MPHPDEGKITGIAVELLSRFNTDPKFAEHFDKNPVEALQAFHPVFAKLPKDKMAAALKSFQKDMKHAMEPAVAKAAFPGGLLILVSRSSF